MEAKMSDKVNYLAQLYGLDEILAKDINIDERYVYTINEKEYKDPDRESKSLYEKWKTFLTDKIPEGEFETCKISGSLSIKAEINEKTFLLSSDYIGPSKYYAAIAFRSNHKNECEEMAKIFNICRRFEGHMIWPKGQYIDNGNIYLSYGRRGQYSINVSRSGSAGVYDRFDVTLYLLKQYYDSFIDVENRSSKTQLYERAEYFINSCKDEIPVKENRYRLLNLFLSFEWASEWLSIFGDFDRFISTFELQDFIMDGKPVIWGKENKIIDLIDNTTYMKYIDNCTKAIENRGKH